MKSQPPYSPPEFVFTIRATDAAFMAASPGDRAILTDAIFDIRELVRARGVSQIGLGTAREILASIGCLIAGYDVNAECRNLLARAAVQREREETET